MGLKRQLGRRVRKGSLLKTKICPTATIEARRCWPLDVMYLLTPPLAFDYRNSTLASELGVSIRAVNLGSVYSAEKAELSQEFIFLFQEEQFKRPGNLGKGYFCWRQNRFEFVTGGGPPYPPVPRHNYLVIRVRSFNISYASEF